MSIVGRRTDGTIEHVACGECASCKAKDAALAALQSENERLSKREKKLLSIIDDYSRKLIRVEGGDVVAKKYDEIDDLRARLAATEGKVEKVIKTINDPMVCEYQQMKNRLLEDLK